MTNHANQSANDMSWLDGKEKSTFRTPTENGLREELKNAPRAEPRKGTSDAASRPDDNANLRDGEGGTTSTGNRGGIRDGSGNLLEDCPVSALGKRGDYAYFLDALGQLTAHKRIELQTVQSLFCGQMPYVCGKFAKWRKGEDGPERVRNQFDGTAVSYALWQAVGECGVFNPENAVRGIGAWTDDDGLLVYHLGDKVLYCGELLPPGRIAGRIYPAAPHISRPVDGGPDPAPDILKTIETWNWAQPDLFPFAALGMIGTQMMGGALRWRPTFWLTAPAASGKSEFQKMLELLHGDGGLVQSTDATKAGITSQLGYSSRPVALDELEPEDERSTKAKDIIALARVASSGGKWSRGSADQSAVGGQVFSSFLFSSILIPGIMKPQDIQRLVRLDMNPIENGKGLSLVPKTWRARGARLKGRLIERWSSMPERTARFRHALETQGVAGRSADNWEVVLTMADMALNEDLPEPDICAAWARKVALTVALDKDEVNNDSDALLAHLLGQTLDPFRRNEQFTVGQWIMVAAGLKGAPSRLMHDYSSDMLGQKERQARANETLTQFGLRIYDEAEKCLFIANSGPQAMRRLFEGSDWAGGVWKQSAARVPKAYRSGGTKTMAGVRTRGVMIPLTSIPALNAPEETKPPTEEKTPARQVDEIEDFR